MSEQEINRIIAENIVRYMEKKGLTQVDVAEHMGVSQATVSNWCKAVKMPRMDKIDRLCELFGCSRTDLLDAPKAEQDDLMASVERLFNERPEARVLFSKAKNASDEDFEKIITIVNTIVGE